MIIWAISGSALIMVTSSTMGPSSCSYQWWCSSQLHHQAFSNNVQATRLVPQCNYGICNTCDKQKYPEPSSWHILKWGLRDGWDPRSCMRYEARCPWHKSFLSWTIHHVRSMLNLDHWEQCLDGQWDMAWVQVRVAMIILFHKQA